MDDRVKKALHLLDAFKACIDEHPIVGEWITEILERAEQTEPQTCEEYEHWNDTEDGCADRHGCKTEPTGYNMSPVEDEPQTDCAWK